MLGIARLLALSLVVVSATVHAESEGVDWPSFRGPQASGTARGYPTATTWNVESSHNIAWKTPIPGLGHSSPVIWGDLLFVTSAESVSRKAKLKVGLYGDIQPIRKNPVHRWNVYCLDKRTGKILWQRTAHEGVPRVRRHPKATHANTTPATDGQHLVVFFGSEGLYTFDFDGNLQWKKDLGVLDAAYYKVPSAQWGFASSPVIFDDRVLIQADVIDRGFLAAFDLTNGHEIWRTSRDDVPTWSTPTVYERNGRAQVVVNGFRHIGGYDLETGRELWRLQGGGDIPVPTPVIGDRHIYITNAHGSMAPIYAIRHSATGDISLKGNAETNNHIAWSTRRDGAYMQTPLVLGRYLYVCRDNGALFVYEAATGKLVYRKRLGRGSSGFSASAVTDGEKIYYTSELGDIHVIRPGPEFHLLAVNKLDEIAMATPAISEGKLFFRTKGHVVAVAAGPPGGAVTSGTDPEIEHLLSTGRVIGRKPIGTGITDSDRLELELDGITMAAAFKTVDQRIKGVTRFDNASAELGFTDSFLYDRAAYLFDRHLDLGMVPVTVLRKIGKTRGAVVAWVDDAVPFHDLSQNDLASSERLRLTYQEGLMKLFDALILNVDRNLGNQLVTKSDFKLHLIDHSRSFRNSKSLPESFLETTSQLSPELYSRLKELDEAELRELFSGLLSKAQVRAVVTRSRAIVEKIDQDRREHGDETVFTSP